MADKINLEMPEMKGDLVLNVNLSGEEKLRQANATIKARDDEILRLKSHEEELIRVNNELNDSLNKFKEQNGIQILEEELETFRNTAQQSLHEFKVFLETVNLNDWNESNNYKFKEFFDQIEKGSMTASEAIFKVKTNWAELFEENYQNGSFGSDMFQSLLATMERIEAVMSNVVSTLNNIQENGVKSIGDAVTGGTGGSGDVTSVLRSIEKATADLSEEATNAYEPITNLVRAMADYGNLDSTKILGVSQAFKNIASIGQGNYGTKNVENIIYLTRQLNELSQSGSGQIKFDFTGFNELKVSKASMRNLAEFLPVISKINVSNLQELSKVDLKNFNEVKVSRGSIEAIANLTESLKVLRDTKVAVAKSENESINISASGSGSIVNASESAKEREAEATREQALAYKDAVAAVKNYYSALNDLATTKNDITQSDGRFVSESGTWDTLANRLNNTREAFIMLTNASNMNNLSTEQQIALLKLMSSESDKYELKLEKLTNKEVASALAENEKIAKAEEARIAKEREAEATREQALAYKDAVAAVKNYYSALNDLATTKNDITQSDGRFVSESGTWDTLANRLNNTREAFIMLTNASNMNNLSTEQQIALLKLMSSESDKYELKLEKLTNKEVASALAENEKIAKAEEARIAKEREAEATREQALAYKEATDIIDRYYQTRMQLVSTDNDIIEDADGTYKSISGLNGLSDALNRSTEDYKRLDEIKSKLSNDKQIELLRRETNAREKLNIAMDKAGISAERANKRENDFVAINKRYEAIMGKIKFALANYTAAQNSKNAASKEAYSILQREGSELENMYARVSATGEGYSELSQRVSQAEIAFKASDGAIKAAGDNMKSLDDRMGGLIKKFAAWFSVSRVVIGAWRTIKQMVSATVELDSAMTQLQIVTRETDAVMSDFSDTAAEASRRIGSSITDFVSSATTFARLGYTLDESATLAEYTAMLQNVGDIDVSDAQDAITAIVKAFSDEIDISNIEQVMDKLVIVGNNFPISVSQIAEGMNNASSTLAAAGNTFEESVALLTAANTTVQNAAKASTGLRTITARIRNTKADLDDLGETMTKANYDEIVQQLTKFNVSLTDVNGEYRSTYDIMKDIAAMWGDMTSMEQAAMATALAGTRQQAIFYSIINNFQEASGAMDAMSNSAGALETAYSTYMESAQAHINQFKAAFQELAYNLVSSGTISFFVDLGTAIVNVVTSLTKAKMLLPSIIGSLLLIKSIGIIKSLRQSESVVKSLASSIINEKKATDVLAASVAKLTLEEKKNLAGKLQAAFASGKLTEEEYKQILATLNLAAAEGAATGATVGFAASLKALFASNPFLWITMGISILYKFGSAMIGASKSVEELTEELNQQQQEIKQISNSYNQMKESTESIIPKFVELAKGVNEFGEKTERLTDEEYKEFVKLNNQLAEIFPDINLGMDEFGKAMLRLSYSSDTLASSLRDLLEAQREVANQQIADKMPDLLDTTSSLNKKYQAEFSGYNGKITAAQAVIDSLRNGKTTFKTRYDDDYSYVEDVLEAVGINSETKERFLGEYTLETEITIDIPEKAVDEYERKLNDYVEGVKRQNEAAKRKLDASWRKLNPVVTAFLQTDYLYQGLGDQTKDVITKIVSGLNFKDLYDQGVKTKDDIEKYIRDNIIDPFYRMSPEASKAFEKMTDWRKQLSNGEISFEEFSNYVKSAYNSLIEGMNDEERAKFEKIFVDSYNAIGVAGNNFDEVVQGIINNWGKLNNSAENQEFTNSISKLVDAMERLKSAYDIVSKAQKEMLTGGISTDTVKSLADFIDKYNEAFETNVDYLDYLYEENGVIKLNIDALKEFANVEMSGSISAIEGDISRLEERRKELQKNIDAQEAISGHHLAGFLWESDDLKKSKEELSGINKEIDENQKKLGIYKSIFDSLTSSYERTISTIEGAIVSVDKLSSGFDNLDKMYADVFNKEDFNFASLIDDKFIETFGSYTEEFDKFIATVANSPTDIKACQDAFDDLVTTYLKHSDIMDGLTDETRDVTVAMLEQMGVANAAEVVDYNLALQKERLKYETAKYRDMTLEEVQALYDESEAGSLTQQVLAELALEKMEINANTIRTSKDIANVIALANAANVSTQSLRNLTAAKIAFDKAEQYRLAGRKLIEQQELYGDMSAYAEATKMFELARDEQRKAEEYFNQKIEFNPFDSAQFKAKYVGGTATQSARDSAAKAAEKAKKEAEKAETWFEREYKLHQHLVKMELETDKDYFTWLNSAYQRAYKEGILTLDEYRKYQEEVFSGLRALFEDYLSDIEHEISMREEFDSEKNKIISLYKQLIKDVESEIKAARQYGLTDTDDYIQSLQKKWASYKDAIKDIEDDINNSAKDAIDELVDIRIKMLKQDIENERDALKKRLDYLKEFYQKQKDMLQDARDEEKYIEEQSAKRKAVSDIQAQMAQLEYDNSAWAQKRKLELAEELSKSQKELDDFEKEHALQTAQEELDKLYEMQEKELNAQEELLEAKGNDTKALYEQALADIKNGSIQLYEEMIQWNDVYGDGISDTIKTAWEDAYVALKNYKDLYGTLYNDVNLANATGYVAPKSSWDTTTVYGGGKAASPYGNSGSSSSTKSSATTSASKAVATTTTATTTAGSVSVDDLTKQRVSAAIWNGGYGWGRGKERAAKLAEVFGENNGIQALVNANVGRSGPAPSQEYTYLNMRKKLKGYASGTSNATVGLHSIDELGTETIFQSADGAKYKMFTGTEKVLNAKASTFLYNFANKGGEILDKIMRSVFGNSINNIGQPVMASNIQMGDIIINGNADKATVSEIRRAQRDSVEMLLKEFNRLNK